MGKIEALTAESLKAMPKEGFIKVTRPTAPDLSSQQRILLIRKANELFGKGEREQAKKIFVATGYSDGMIRMGDHYAGQKDYLSAYQMYKMAPAPEKAEVMIVKLTDVLRNWIKE